MITHILSNLPEEYQAIVKILADKIDHKDYPITMENIRGKFSVILDQMKGQSVPRTPREYGKDLYIKSQYKGTFTNCGKYGRKGENC